MASHSSPHEVPLNPPSEYIRLIELAQASDGMISCAFHVYRILECPPFIALSYAWGNPLPVHNIKLQGYSYPIRENLHKALKSILNQLSTFQEASCEPLDESVLSASKSQESINVFDYFRSTAPETNRYLFWIDQICIDQNNTMERSGQVLIMGQLFSQASLVSSWLGPAQKNDDKAMGLIRRRNLDVEPWYWPTITTFCNREYWTRMWIVQEIIQAKRLLLLCGSQTLSFSDLYDFVIDLNDYKKVPYGPDGEIWLQPLIKGINSSGLRAVVSVRETLEKKSKTRERFTLHSAITHTYKQQCADDRDRVYALLSLVPSTSIVPNYSKSIGDLHKECVFSLSKDIGKPDIRYFSEVLCKALKLDAKRSFPNHSLFVEGIYRILMDRFMPKRLKSGLYRDIDFTLVPQQCARRQDITTAAFYTFLPPSEDNAALFWRYITACSDDEKDKNINPNTRAFSKLLWLILRAVVFFSFDIESTTICNEMYMETNSAFEGRILEWSLPDSTYVAVHDVIEHLVTLPAETFFDNFQPHLDPLRILLLAHESSQIEPICDESELEKCQDFLWRTEVYPEIPICRFRLLIDRRNEAKAISKCELRRSEMVSKWGTQEQMTPFVGFSGEKSETYRIMQKIASRNK